MSPKEIYSTWKEPHNLQPPHLHLQPQTSTYSPQTSTYSPRPPPTSPDLQPLWTAAPELDLLPTNRSIILNIIGPIKTALHIPWHVNDHE